MDKITPINKDNANEEKPKMGRPIKWDEETRMSLADRMIIWAKKSNSYALVQFCRDERLCPSTLPDLARNNNDFSEALLYVKTWLASRMIEELNSKEGGCHPAFFNKYIRNNDWLLNQHLKETDKAEANEIAKHVVRVIDYSKYKATTPDEEKGSHE